MKGSSWTPPSLPAFLKVWLEHNLSMARATGGSLAVFAIRIDAYHDLVQSWGEPALEIAFLELASRLKKTLRPTDALMRSDNDCFTIIQPAAGDHLALHATAKTMLKQMQRPVRLGMDERCLAASIGIASYPEDGNSADLLLGHAKEALRRTDRFGGNGFCFHSLNAARKIADDLAEHKDLRRALDNDDLSMRFQPILDLSKSCMIGVTGEIHWPRQEHASLNMAAVAAIAERAELAVKLNQWWLDRVCRQLNDWRDSLVVRPISVEVTRSQIVDGHLARHLTKGLAATGTSADQLEIGIDHGLLSDDTDHRFHTGLQHLAELGIAFNLTNVGKGPLAMQKLANMPLRSAGLAPEMVAVIGRCPSSETMLEALIGFAHDLGLSVRAVDVGNQEQLDFLKTCGCDEATGSIFAPALKGEDIERLTGLKPCFTQKDLRGLTKQPLVMH